MIVFIYRYPGLKLFSLETGAIKRIKIGNSNETVAIRKLDVEKVCEDWEGMRKGETIEVPLLQNDD